MARPFEDVLTIAEVCHDPIVVFVGVVTLPTVQAFTDTDPLNRRVVDQMLSSRIAASSSAPLRAMPGAHTQKAETHVSASTSDTTGGVKRLLPIDSDSSAPFAWAWDAPSRVQSRARRFTPHTHFAV